MRFKADHL